MTGPAPTTTARVALRPGDGSPRHLVLEGASWAHCSRCDSILQTMSWHLLDVETGNVLCGNCTPARLAAGEAVLDDVDAVHLLADDPAVPLGIRKGALRLIDAEAHAGRTAADTVLRALSYLEATGGLDAVRAMLALPASEAPARTRRRTAA